ncbi:MAG: AAA domain-containing protein, partial [Thermoproteota archaeon]
IQELLDNFQEELQKLESELEPMAETCKTLTATTPHEFDQAINAAKLILHSPKVTRQILENEEWDKTPPKTDSIIDTLYRLKSFERSLTQKFHDKALNQDPTSLLREYRELAPKLTRFFRRRYWQVKGEINDLYKINLPGEHQVISDLEELRSYRRTLRKIQAYKAEAESIFGPHWKGGESDPQKLEEFSAWIIQFRNQIRKGILQEEAINLVINGFDKEQLRQAIQNSDEVLTSFHLSATNFFTRVDAHAEEMFGKPFEEVDFEELKSRLELCQDNLSDLQPWSTYIMKRKQCLRYHGSGVVDAVERGDLDAEDLVPCFKGNFADEMLNETFSERPVLAQFLGEAHEKRIQRFRELDKKLIRYNQERLKAKLLQRKPALLTGASRGSEVGILLHEMGKKRRHMPIRILMNKAGSLIRKFKPCFMMSPLSVSQYLDPGTMNFDLVIFDEASQVKPEDALGAIMRGERLVVMGDTKQLPPTTFFDHIMEKDESYEEWIPSITDVESILYKCREVFPTKSLRWHYRSKHESLITVSNQEFYDNRLVVFPSPLREDEYLGLKFTHLPGTTYDRGGTRINREEARRVAQAALDHYKKYPEKSLGVGTFSTAQQEAILEEVEILRKQNPEMDKYFSHDREEYFFVKNLETIQGDERDVIYISVGYGFDESDNMTLQFGPLTYTDGWKRLNVLITRAREQCKVFSNFTAYDLKLHEDTKKGVRSLKVFLKYAQDRNLEPIAQVGRETESSFIGCVKGFLEDEGYEVHPQVGTAGFRIDLAIVHPEKSGEYLLAVECDGSKYYTSKVARERDRLRQQVLEDRGWIIHRVWSPDWYRNREATRQRLLKAIEIAKNNPTPHTKPPKRREEEPPIAVTQKEEGHTINHQDLEDLIPPYQKCNSLSLPNLTEEGYSGGEYPIIDELATAIQKLVEAEGPISIEQVLNRIREYSPIERISKKIHTTVNNAIRHADLHGKIEKKGKFLWPNPHNGPLVRRRTGDLSTDIDQICDEEIAEATRIVLRHQFSTPKQELITQTSRLMGIQRTTTKVSHRIAQVIDRLVQTGEMINEEGQLGLPKTQHQPS